MRIKQVSLKLGNMRKPEEFVVYPRAADSPTVTVQSSHRIGQFRVADGVGVFSAYRSGGAYSIHLSLGATPVVLDPVVLAEILGAVPNSGDEIGPGVFIA